MNRTWQNGARPNFGLDFGLFGSNLDPQKTFGEFYLY